LVNGETVIFAINLRMATLSVPPSTGTCNAKKGITEIILKVGVLREKKLGYWEKNRPPTPVNTQTTNTDYLHHQRRPPPENLVLVLYMTLV
jgi:hypothetical protein